MDVPRRVLVRLSPRAAKSVSDVDLLLGSGFCLKARYFSPGPRATLQLLERLEHSGLAAQSGEGWLLTPTGVREYEHLEDAFHRSGGLSVDCGF